MFPSRKARLLGLVALLGIFSWSCSSVSTTTYTNKKHKYTVETSTVWAVKAEEGAPAEADEVVLYRIVDAPGQKAVYDPKTMLSGEQPFNGNILTLTVKAVPNPEKLDPVAFLSREAKADGRSVDPSKFQSVTFQGRPAVRQMDLGGQRYWLTVDQTLFSVWGIELPGRDTKEGRSLPSDPEAVKILQQTLDSVRFGQP